jgi:hypothetical protein
MTVRVRQYQTFGQVSFWTRSGSLGLTAFRSLAKGISPYCGLTNSRYDDCLYHGFT